MFRFEADSVFVQPFTDLHENAGHSGTRKGLDAYFVG
jgi:hypothetical protein